MLGVKTSAGIEKQWISLVLVCKTQDPTRHNTLIITTMMIIRIIMIILIECGVLWDPVFYILKQMNFIAFLCQLMFSHPTSFYIALHYIAVHCSTLHYITLHVQLHLHLIWITLHYITLHYIILYYIVLYYMQLYYIICWVH